MYGKKILKISVFLSFFLYVPFFFHAQVISPESGTWANRQLLIVDVPAEGNVFYSLNGTDPERSGFAYDGPVLIDLDGEVSVNISIIDKNGNRVSRKVSYIVKEIDAPKENQAEEFINSVVSQGMVEYLAGDSFTIPSSLEYCLGEKPEIFSAGTDLSLSSEMVIS
ncbi:MAG: chitobiase/beta-hexosaminidase C-terminal domain-containing protein, partial [Treponema sp.]|nr:chitobiase/beta-hexosaminidase C-terminal domain-containing protein [Treponema sp.]